MSRLDWMERAACRGQDPELWDLERGARGQDYYTAHAICAACPVRQLCYDMAERTGSWSMIFGGRDFGRYRVLPIPKEERARALPRMCECGCGVLFSPIRGDRQRYVTKQCRSRHQSRLRREQERAA